MALNYTATKKVDKSSGVSKELYYASACVGRNNSANNVDLVKIMKEETSLGAQDLLTVLELLPMAIERVISNGQSVNIKGLGYFSASVTSEGVHTVEELTPDKVIISRVAFRADQKLTKRLKDTKFTKID